MLAVGRGQATSTLERTILAISVLASVAIGVRATVRARRTPNLAVPARVLARSPAPGVIMADRAPSPADHDLQIMIGGMAAQWSRRAMSRILFMASSAATL